FFYCYGPHRHLHSFPTRRSSDLAVITYALRHPEEIDAYMRKKDEDAAEIRALIEARQGPNPELRARIEKCRAERAKKNAATSERSEEHTSELQSQSNLVCRLLLE